MAEWPIRVQRASPCFEVGRELPCAIHLWSWLPCPAEVLGLSWDVTMLSSVPRVTVLCCLYVSCVSSIHKTFRLLWPPLRPLDRTLSPGLLEGFVEVPSPEPDLNPHDPAQLCTALIPCDRSWNPMYRYTHRIVIYVYTWKYESTKA